MSHTICHTHTNLTHNFVTYQLCKPSLSTTIFHTPSFTHNLSHTILYTHIHLRFTWQAWHLWHCVARFVAVGRRWSPVTPRHFAWQAWLLVTSTFVSRGRRGAISHPPSFHVAGVAQSHIHLRFAWKVWHNLTSTFVLCGRRGTYGTVWRASSPLVSGDVAALCVGRRGAWRHPPSFRVAGVAQSHIHLLFTWQAWRSLTSTFVLRGRCGTISRPPSFCMAGVAFMALYGALRCRWSPVTLRHFAWQAWHLAHPPSFHVVGVAQSQIHLRFAWQAWRNLTSTFVLRRGKWRCALCVGRRGAWRHPPSFRVAGVAISHPPSFHVGAVSHPPSFCVAGVAQSRVHLRFVWQAWHLWHCMARFVAVGRRYVAALCLAGVALGAWHNLRSTFVLRGRRGAISHPPSFCMASMVLMALCGALGRRWSPVTPRHFAWQAWHLETSTFVLRCRRGTWRHPPSFHVTGVAQSHIDLGFAWQAWHLWHCVARLVAGDVAAPHCHPPSLSRHLSHTTLSPTIFHTRLYHTPSLTLTHPLSHTTLSHTIFHAPLLSHTIFHTPLCHTIFQLCHTLSFTHHFVTPSFNFVTHYLSHTTLSHAIFHTPSLTLHLSHHFVTHHLSHTTFVPHHPSHTALSHTIFHHTIFHTQLCRTPSFTTPSFIHNFIAHHLPPHHLSHTTLSPTIFHTQLSHPPSLTHHLSHTTLSHTPSVFVTHHLSHTTLSHHLSTLSHFIFHTSLCHTIFQLCHTLSFTHHFVTHHLSHTTFVPHHPSHTALSHTIFHHTIFHTQLCRTPSFTTPSFTHNFVAHHLPPHHLSHTTLSPTIFHTQLSHPPSLTHHLSHTTLSHTPSVFVTHHLSYTTLSHTTLFYFSVLHHLLCLSLLAEVSCLMGLSGPLIFCYYNGPIYLEMP